METERLLARGVLTPGSMSKIGTSISFASLAVTMSFAAACPSPDFETSAAVAEQPDELLRFYLRSTALAKLELRLAELGGAAPETEEVNLQARALRDVDATLSVLAPDDQPPLDAAMQRVLCLADGKADTDCYLEWFGADQATAQLANLSLDSLSSPGDEFVARLQRVQQDTRREWGEFVGSYSGLASDLEPQFWAQASSLEQEISALAPIVEEIRLSNEASREHAAVIYPFLLLSQGASVDGCGALDSIQQDLRNYFASPYYEKGDLTADDISVARDKLRRLTECARDRVDAFDSRTSSWWQDYQLGQLAFEPDLLASAARAMEAKGYPISDVEEVFGCLQTCDEDEKPSAASRLQAHVHDVLMGFEAVKNLASIVAIATVAYSAIAGGIIRLCAGPVELSAWVVSSGSAIAYTSFAAGISQISAGVAHAARQRWNAVTLLYAPTAEGFIAYRDATGEYLGELANGAIWAGGTLLAKAAQHLALARFRGKVARVTGTQGGTAIVEGAVVIEDQQLLSRVQTTESFTQNRQYFWQRNASGLDKYQLIRNLPADEIQNLGSASEYFNVYFDPTVGKGQFVVYRMTVMNGDRYAVVLNPRGDPSQAFREALNFVLELIQ